MQSKGAQRYEVCNLPGLKSDQHVGTVLRGTSNENVVDGQCPLLNYVTKITLISVTLFEIIMCVDITNLAQYFLYYNVPFRYLCLMVLNSEHLNRRSKGAPS